MEDRTILTVLGLFFDLVAVTIVICNTLVIHVIRRSNRLHTITNRFILSLACSDLMAGLFIGWQSAFNYNPELDLVDVTCISRLVQIQPSYSSVIHLLTVAIDRYMAVLHPLRYHEMMTKQVANVMIGLTWMLSIALTSTLLGSARFVQGVSLCMIPDIIPERVVIGAIHVPFTAIVLLMCALYAKILWVARKQSRQIRAQEVWSRDRKSSSFGKELKAAKQLSLIVMVFLVCHSMFYVVSLLGYGYKQLGLSGETYLIYYKLSTLAVFFNSLMNPILYAFRNREFKIAFMKILCKERLMAGRSTGLDDTSQITNYSIEYTCKGNKDLTIVNI